MVKSGRAMYDWPIEDGGVPPTFDHVVTSREKINPFIESILGKHGDRLDDGVKRLLVANALRFYPDFMALISDDIYGRYKADLNTQHSFCYRVSKCYIFNISILTI